MSVPINIHLYEPYNRVNIGYNDYIQEADFTFNVICVTDKHSLKMDLWEVFTTVSLQIGMNGMIFAAGTVGLCLPLTSKITPLNPICILYPPSLDILYTAPISL